MYLAETGPHRPQALGLHYGVFLPKVLTLRKLMRPTRVKSRGGFTRPLPSLVLEQLSLKFAPPEPHTPNIYQTQLPAKQDTDVTADAVSVTIATLG